MFLTSDTHWFHKRMLDFRPFASVEEMNEALIHNWNRVVGKTAEIYHLGDFSFGNAEKTREILSRLNGQIHLVLGNHDHVIPKVADCFASISPYRELKYNKQTFCLMHYPLLVWNKSHYGSYMLHGHSHGGLNELNGGTTRLDVGVDNFNYTPLHIDDIVKILEKRQYVPVDHHK